MALSECTHQGVLEKKVLWWETRDFLMVEECHFAMLSKTMARGCWRDGCLSRFGSKQWRRESQKMGRLSTICFIVQQQHLSFAQLQRTIMMCVSCPYRLYSHIWLMFYRERSWILLYNLPDCLLKVILVILPLLGLFCTSCLVHNASVHIM